MDILKDPRNSVVIHRVNFCEVYYRFLQTDSHDIAEEAHLKIGAVMTIMDVEEEFACPLITSDHGDFDPVAAAQIIQIAWFP